MVIVNRFKKISQDKSCTTTSDETFTERLPVMRSLSAQTVDKSD